MRALVTSLCLAGLLAACTPADRDQVTRSAARSVVSRVVVQQFPGVPVQPAIDCIIDNATTPELVGLASDAVTGPTAATTEVVTRIASRPPTIQCLVGQGLPALLRTGA
ncbi:hypothetical protein SAMN04488012_106101 [Palleronia salina]|uniref:Succinate dehydrogenase n=1 Tax=Palleronia salina TaxID=313368 RepID=A0A1M6HQK1_9RHOB|nr:hypothetical protein [Palleronia salina]SHJ24423.1 hypothetical protein SAMN04488012_106101 [Palleronia salina]